VLRYLREFGRYCEITGFRGVEIDDLNSFLKSKAMEGLGDVVVQFFDADLVATWQHLYFALFDALTAFKNGGNVSRSLAVETILFTSAKRQIRRATESIGLKGGLSNVAVLLIGEKAESVKLALARISEKMNGELDESVLELSKQKLEKIKSTFGISETEIESVVGDSKVENAVVDLVIERAALLASLC
jgi:tRNA threonylcarbamoyladenosine modification (KEOPS) complex Cgi121 subunit